VQRHKLGPLLSEIREKAGVILQAGCIVYVFREYCVEVSVVGLPWTLHLLSLMSYLSNTRTTRISFLQYMGASMLPMFIFRESIAWKDQWCLCRACSMCSFRLLAS